MSWIKTAKVGDKVVCIDREWENVYGLEDIPEPTFGSIYTIKAIYALGSGTYLLLEEMNNDCGYERSGFRPVQPRDTDISIFTAMLKTAPAKVREDA